MEAAVRRARGVEADALTHLALAAKAHWGYPAAWMDEWRDALTFTPAYVEAHPVYVAEGADGAPAGCYALGRDGDRTTLEHLWVSPAAMGQGVGRALLIHAAETARAGAADRFWIESDPHAEGFYLRAGAVRVGDVPADIDGTPRLLPLLVLGLGTETAS